MIKLKITNPNLSGEEKTFLTADYPGSGSTLSVRNSDNFTVNWFAVVGEPGQERTQLKRVTALPGATSLTIASALSFSYPKSTPVYRSHYNQISLERKPSGGSYSEVAKYDIEWDNDDKKTFIAVGAGVSTDTYRWRFYNSASGEYTDYSDELLGTGVRRNSLAYVLDQVQRNPLAKNVDIAIMTDYANDFQELVYDEIPKAWWWQREGTALATVANTYEYSISTYFNDLLSIKFLRYRYISGDIDETYLLNYIPLNEFYAMKSDANQSSDDAVKSWTFIPPDTDSVKGYIGVHPTPETTACRIMPVYHVEPTALTQFGDTLLVPHPKAYIDYVLYRIFDDIKNEDNLAAKYNQRVARNILALKKRSRRQLGQNDLFRFRGTRGASRLYGENINMDWQTAKENYW